MTEYSLTINATFTADTQQDAWDECGRMAHSPSATWKTAPRLVEFPEVHTHTWGASPQPDGWHAPRAASAWQAGRCQTENRRTVL